jgi:DNA-binding beta-propeller fold protein YncE
LDIIDLEASKLIKSVPTGAAQGVAIDDKGGRYFVSVSKPPQMVVVDSTKLEVTGTVPLPGPADLVAYHPESNRVFVCNDEKPEMWIIDPVALKIVATLTLPGAGMEDLGFDSQDKALFQCLKETSQLSKIDPVEGKVLATWPTGPAEKPHGMAILPGKDSVLVVGGTGKLSLINLTSGQVFASCDVSPRIDEMAYDPGLQRAYGASGLGTISVVSIGSDKLTPLAPAPSSPGAHSIAVDPQTHTVWIVYAKDGKPYVQAFQVKGAVSP